MSRTATIEEDAAAARAHGSSKPARWTSTNIAIHWTIVGLLALQLITQNWIGELRGAKELGAVPTGMSSFFGIAHMVVGTLVLLLMIYRFWDLYKFGRPPHPPGEPKWSEWLATANHWAFYALLVAIPLGGMIAWFFDSDITAWAHATAAKVLAVLVVVHILGAIAHQVWFKTSVLKRKMPGAGEATRDGQRRPETAGL